MNTTKIQKTIKQKKITLKTAPPVGKFVPPSQVSPQFWYQSPGAQKMFVQLAQDLDTLRINLKIERQQQGLTQRQLAAAIGLSQGTITRAETRMWVSLNVIQRMAYGLGKKITIA